MSDIQATLERLKPDLSVFTARIPSDLHAKLRKAAHKVERSANQVVTAAIVRAVDEILAEPPPPSN